ncbi:PREDICTED: programmed cell death 1 ligand 2 isoform X3 [Pseudopodoces humilis]|uniref:programmed cell death 1 ligand 2 isoform X3 n=1 Tax=Pseudopodoces humilis TaxID=181119 RepID=UPI0006B7B8B1|nr:PREDICTED: programmed cell death 1 ligand 2 isoform X3 [Pseudopodoces humilis]
MFQILTILLLETQFSMVSALLTVEVPQQLYTAEYGSNVTMECRFPVNGSIDLGLLTVLWEQKRQGWLKSKEVYTLRNGKVLHPSQHPDYIGRASLLHRELKLGRAILQITNVKITDAGSYLCLIEYQGVDYKYIALEVKALTSTQYSGQKILISLIIPICVTVAVLLSALITFQKRKSFKNEQPKKDRKRKLNPNAKDENSDDFSSQTEALYLSTVTASRDSGTVGL